MQIFLTAEGKKELEERLDHLKTVKRSEISERIKEARGFGDISENAEYDAAKDEQALVEGEIMEIEAKLTAATIISDVTDVSEVSLGSKVTVDRTITGSKKERLTYQIVGTSEVNPFINRISNESPVGKALLGLKCGASTEVRLPGDRTAVFKVISIEK